MSYLQFEEVPNPDRKTKRWTVMNLTNAVLGGISFSGAWRKYVFQSVGESQFDSNCLREIVDFLNSETQTWRNSL